MSNWCNKCNKFVGTAIQETFDRFPGPLQPGKDFGICSCPSNDKRRQDEREKHWQLTSTN